MQLSNVRRVLVIKLRHLGDVLLAAPVFRILQSALPNASIDAYIYRESQPMLEGHPAISRFFLYDRSWKKLAFFQRMREELAILWEMRKRQYDLVINLTEGDRGALVALISGAPIRVGFDPGEKGFFRKRKIFTHLVKNCSKPRHAVERNLDAVRCLGIFPPVEERIIDFAIPPAAKEVVAQIEARISSLTPPISQESLRLGPWLRSTIAAIDKPRRDFLIIHPVSRWRFKCLPSQKIVHLIEALRRRGEKIVLTAGPDARECEMIEEILQLAGEEGIISLAGKLSLKELGALFLQTKAVITVDSVTLHLASALKVPVVALFGPSSEENWGPWQHPKARVVAEALSCRPCHLDGCGGSKRSDCLDRISIGAIIKAYEEVSGQAARSSVLYSLPVGEP